MGARWDETSDRITKDAQALFRAGCWRDRERWLAGGDAGDKVEGYVVRSQPSGVWICRAARCCSEERAIQDAAKVTVCRAKMTKMTANSSEGKEGKKVRYCTTRDAGPQSDARA